MRLITLMENTACDPRLHREHGLSLYLEACGKRILFDAGQSGAFADNARVLGVDLSAVDMMVLSHGHYDHGGGIARFLQINDHAPVYLSRHAFGGHYNASGRYIGLDPALQGEPRLVPVDQTLSLGPGLTLVTLDTPPADTGGLTMRRGGQLLPEDFRHEQYLLMEEDGKRILISGCSHKGILQIAGAFRPDILVGGFHFMKLEDRAALEEAGRALSGLAGTYCTGHCTGQRQYDILKAVMGSRLMPISTGTRLTL